MQRIYDILGKLMAYFLNICLFENQSQISGLCPHERKVHKFSGHTLGSNLNTGKVQTESGLNICSVSLFSILGSSFDLYYLGQEFRNDISS